MKGTAAGCMNCTSLILSKLLEEGKISYVVRGTTYPRNLGDRLNNSKQRDREIPKDNRVIKSTKNNRSFGKMLPLNVLTTIHFV